MTFGQFITFSLISATPPTLSMRPRPPLPFTGGEPRWFRRMQWLSQHSTLAPAPTFEPAPIGGSTTSPSNRPSRCRHCSAKPTALASAVGRTRTNSNPDTRSGVTSCVASSPAGHRGHPQSVRTKCRQPWRRTSTAARASDSPTNCHSNTPEPRYGDPQHRAITATPHELLGPDWDQLAPPTGHDSLVVDCHSGAMQR